MMQTEKKSLYLTPEQWGWLQQEADKRCMTLTGFVRDLIIQWHNEQMHK